MRTLFLATALSILSSPSMASEPTVVQQLRADLAGKSFTLATEIAGYSCVYSGTLDFPTNRLVDTEIDTFGSRRYYLRADRFMNVTHCPNPVGRTSSLGGEYIPGGYITRMYRTGHRVSVKLVEAKADRIEIQLTPEGVPSGDESYMKVKLMLGKGYEITPLEIVETVLAKAIRIPRIESLLSIRASLLQADSTISTLENKLRAENDPGSRLELARTLRSEYQTRVSIVEQYNTVAFEKRPSADISTKLAEFESIATEAQERVNVARVESAQRDYTLALKRCTQSCQGITRKPPTTLSELETQLGTVNTVLTEVERYSATREKALSLGISTEKPAEEFVLRCSRDAQNAKVALERQRPALVDAQAREAEAKKRKEIADRIAALRTEYGKLKQQRLALDAKLLSTLGSTSEGEVFEEYRVHVGRMMENRQLAIDLGDQTAQLELAGLQEDLRKLR